MLYDTVTFLVLECLTYDWKFNTGLLPIVIETGLWDIYVQTAE